MARKRSFSMGSWFSAATLWDPEIELRLSGLHTSIPTEPYLRETKFYIFLKRFVSSHLCSMSPSLKGYFFPASGVHFCSTKASFTTEPVLGSGQPDRNVNKLF